jgi:hypothetical protein
MVYTNSTSLSTDTAIGMERRPNQREEATTTPTKIIAEKTQAAAVNCRRETPIRDSVDG